MRGPVATPSAWDRQKYVRPLRDEIRLLFRCEHQVAIALFFGSQSGENSAAHAKVGRSHVRSFLRTGQAQRNPSKIGRLHYRESIITASMRYRIWIAARAVLLGWLALFAFTYLVERPLLSWTAPLLGAAWSPTAQLALACVGLAATGWIVGRWNRFHALIFASSLAVWNFGLVPIDLLWLLRLLSDSFESSRYIESFLTSLVTHVLLFSSLFAGAALNRARQPAFSLNLR